jgi:hypothetical protein
MSDWIASFESERIVPGLVELARARKTARLIVAGYATSNMLVELGRCGFVNAFSTKTYGLPRAQYDVAMVAWSDHSIKALETTLNWLVHLLGPTDPPQLLLHSLLRRADPNNEDVDIEPPADAAEIPEDELLAVSGDYRAKARLRDINRDRIPPANQQVLCFRFHNNPFADAALIQRPCQANYQPAECGSKKETHNVHENFEHFGRCPVQD